MRLRGALLGAGNVALHGHAPQWAHVAMLQDVEIVAVADPNDDRLDMAQSFFPNATRYSCAKRLLEDEDALDFCDICTPPASHSSLIEQAAMYGRHVLCEKPIAPTVDEALRLEEVIKAAGIVFQPCHRYRHSPAWLTVERLLPRLGRIYLAEYEVHGIEPRSLDVEWTPSWQPDQGLLGGGILVDQGAHVFCQLRAMLGEPKTVRATVRTLQHESYRVEDTALVVLDVGEGCLARVSLTWAAHRRETRFRLLGERGEIAGDDSRVRIHAETSAEIKVHQAGRIRSGRFNWYGPLFQGFTRKIRRREQGHDGLDEAIFVTRLIARAYESSREGRALPFAEKKALAIPDDGLPTETPIERVEATVRSLSDARPNSWGVRVAAGAVLGGVATWAAAGTNWSALGSQVLGVHVGWLLAAAGIYICALTLGTARWQAQLRGVSKSVPFGFTLRAFIKGIACSTIASPRASISARVRALSRGMHLSARSVLVSVVLDSVLTAIGLATTLAVLGSWSDLPPRIWPEVATGLGLLTLAVALPSAVFVSRHVLSAAMSLLRLGIARWPLGLCLSLGLAITVSILELVQVLCCLKAVGVGQPLGLAIVALLAMKLAKLVPFVPAGSLVVAEASAVIVLMGSGVAREQAVAFAIVNCATLLGPLVLFGVAMSPRSGRALASG